MKRSRLTPWLLLLAGWLVCAVALGRDAFLQLPGIEGEATDEHHQGWIEVSGVTNRLSLAGPRETVIHEFILMKGLDKASPLLFQACAEQRRLPMARLDLVTASPLSVRYYEITLTNVLILAVHARGDSGPKDDHGTESVRLGCVAMTWAYTELAPQTLLPRSYVTSYWDLRRRLGGLTNHAARYTVTGIQTGRSNVLLQWNRDAGCHYRVYASPQVTGPYLPFAELGPADEEGVPYTTQLGQNACFFVVERIP